MNNEQECFEALIDGDLLVNAVSGIKVKLYGGRVMGLVTGEYISVTFSDFENWKKIDDKLWFDYITVGGGVLCWTSQVMIYPDSRCALELVTGRTRSNEGYLVKGSVVPRRYATPLTPIEVGEFYKTALKVK